MTPAASIRATRIPRTLSPTRTSRSSTTAEAISGRITITLTPCRLWRHEALDTPEAAACTTGAASCGRKAAPKPLVSAAPVGVDSHPASSKAAVAPRLARACGADGGEGRKEEDMSMRMTPVN
jgi:hypothetical protein